MGGTAFLFWSINASLFFPAVLEILHNFQKSSHRCVCNQGVAGSVVFILTSHFSWTRFRKFLPLSKSCLCVAKPSLTGSRTKSRQQKNRDIALDKFVTTSQRRPYFPDVGCLWFITSAWWQSPNRHEAISEQFSLSVNSFWLGACFECQVN